jgi:hypothetical protein
MAILEISRGGEPLPVLVIMDAKGEPRRYTVMPAVVAGAVFACDLPASAGDGEVYTVWLATNGSWFCSCPDFHFRMKRESQEQCKHGDAVEQHYAGLEIFFLGLERWREVRRILDAPDGEPLPADITF